MYKFNNRFASPTKYAFRIKSCSNVETILGSNFGVTSIGNYLILLKSANNFGVEFSLFLQIDFNWNYLLKLSTIRPAWYLDQQTILGKTLYFVQTSTVWPAQYLNERQPGHSTSCRWFPFISLCFPSPSTLFLLF